MCAAVFWDAAITHLGVNPQICLDMQSALVYFAVSLVLSGGKVGDCLGAPQPSCAQLNVPRVHAKSKIAQMKGSR